MTEAKMGTRPYDWREAWDAMRGMMRDPNDVPQLFRIVNALPGYAFSRLARKMRCYPESARLLEQQPIIRRALCDRERLEAMPEDSLGRAYLRFMDAEQISAQGLLDAEDAATVQRQRKPDEEFVWSYMRDTHDLVHVVTGYKGDLKGEPSLLAFNYAQTWIPGLGFIATMVVLFGSKLPGIRRMMVEAFVRGLRADWIFSVDWEHLLPLPVEEVRQRLKIPPLRPYQPLRLSDFPDGKLPT
jgi:ubiquinone biosynthesis protein COQ4